MEDYSCEDFERVLDAYQNHYRTEVFVRFTENQILLADFLMAPKIEPKLPSLISVIQDNDVLLLRWILEEEHRV